MISLRDFDALRARLEMNSSGRLSLNEQEMILLPRHFFRYILREIKNVAGDEAFEKILYKVGFDGALTFCQRFQVVHNCSPREAVENYLAEMSLRGWGQFVIHELDQAAVRLEVRLHNSALNEEADLPAGNIIWNGAMLGAMSYFMRASKGVANLKLEVNTAAISTSGHSNPTYRIVVTSASGE